MDVPDFHPVQDSPPSTEDAPSQWKRDLLAACAEAIAKLPDAPPLPSSGPAADPPSLSSFFEEIVVLRNEVRKGNRRTAETFSKFGDVLETMREDSSRIRDRLANPPGAEASPSTPRKFALDLVDLLDRTARLEAATRTRASQGWLARIRSGDGWVQQAEALSILHDHLQHFLTESNIERIHAAPGTAFDPHLMKAVERESSPGAGAGDTSPVVSEELLPGYRLGEQCLRPAEVRVRLSNPSPTHE